MRAHLGYLERTGDRGATAGGRVAYTTVARVVLWGVLPKFDVTKTVFLVLCGRVCGCLEDI